MKQIRNKIVHHHLRFFQIFVLFHPFSGSAVSKSPFCVIIVKDLLQPKILPFLDQVSNLHVAKLFSSKGLALLHSP